MPAEETYRFSTDSQLWERCLFKEAWKTQEDNDALFISRDSAEEQRNKEKKQ